MGCDDFDFAGDVEDDENGNDDESAGGGGGGGGGGGCPGRDPGDLGTPPLALTLPESGMSLKLTAFFCVGVGGVEGEESLG